MAGVVWAHVIAGEISSSRETQDALTPVAVENTLVPRNRLSPPPGTSVPAGRGGSGLVDEDHPTARRETLRDSSPGPLTVLGHILIGVGSPPPRPISVGDMVSGGDLFTHQPPRDEGPVPSPSGVQGPGHGPPCDRNVRQLDSGGLCQQTRGHGLRRPLLVDRATNPMVRGQQSPARSEVLAGAVRRPGRSPQPP